MSSRETMNPAPINVYRANPQYFWGDLVAAWLVATVASALPSTLYAVLTGGDAMEATLAAGSMLVGASSSLEMLLLAAAIVHAGVSFFWATVLTLALPRRHVVLFATLAAAAIAVLDLRVLGQYFPDVYALPFWPQLADHLVWGASLGAVLRQRSKQRPVPGRTFD